MTTGTIDTRAIAAALRGASGWDQARKALAQAGVAQADSIGGPPVSLSLSGDPTGAVLQSLVVVALSIGCHVELIEPGAFRLQGSDVQLQTVAAAFDAIKTQAESLGISLGVETAPTDRTALKFIRAADRPPVRSTEIRGGPRAPAFVTLAIESGLNVAVVGAGRFHVSGRTAQQVAWLQKALAKSREDVLAWMLLTEEQARAEDEGTPPPVQVTLPELRVELPAVQVELPTRQTVSEIERDLSTGDIKKVTQTERSV